MAHRREPKLDTLRELKQMVELAGETREVLQRIEADKGEHIFEAVSASVTETMRTLNGVVSAYRYNRSDTLQQVPAAAPQL